jgi:outer membrane beta-barrel protein
MAVAGAFQTRNGEILPMRTIRGLRVILAVCCLLVAFDTGVAADDEPAVVKQRYNLEGRFEIMLTPTMSAFDKYTRHIGTALGVAYFFNDYLGVEVEGGYAFISSDRKLLDEILKNSETLGTPLHPNESISRLPLTDLKRITWWATAGVIFSPLYGKLNFSAEFAVNFHLYLVAGWGVAEYHYSELNWNSPLLPPDNKVDVNYGSYGTPYFGGGLRFHINERWSLRMEARDIFFKDDYKHAQHKPSGTTVEEKKIEDFVHTVFVRLGVCLAF